MAKVQLTESEVIKIVESATKEALSKILNEGGATIDAMKAAYKGAQEFSDDDLDVDWKDLTDISGDYDKYLANKSAYTAAKARNIADSNKLKNAMDNSDSFATSTINDLKGQERVSRKDRYNKAFDQIEARPGLAGAASRAGVYGAAKVGQGVGKLKKGVKNFVHDKLGFEE